MLVTLTLSAGINNISQPSNPYHKRVVPFEEGVCLVKKRKLSQEIQDDDFIVRLKRAMAAVDRLCTVCIVLEPTKTNPVSHTANNCTCIDFRHFVQWKKALWYKNHIHSPICTICNVPQIDDMLHKLITSGTRAIDECPYLDHVLPLIYTIYCNTMACGAAQAHFKTCWPIDVEFAQWLIAPSIALSRTNTFILIYTITVQEVGSLILFYVILFMDSLS